MHAYTACNTVETKTTYHFFTRKVTGTAIVFYRTVFFKGDNSLLYTWEVIFTTYRKFILVTQNSFQKCKINWKYLIFKSPE